MTRRAGADIAKLYHLGSSHERATLRDARLDMDDTPPRFRSYPDAPRVPLPGRDFEVAMPLGAALEKRRSIRDYDQRPLPLVTLGRLLHTAYGLRVTRRADGTPIYDRPVPSAGARYPLELYVATQKVSDLADGVYHYDSRGHALSLIRPGLAQPALADLSVGQEVVGAANAVVIITATRERTMWKYGQRGYRLVLLDAGHVGQSLYLVATALGLGPTGIGGFYDAELSRFLSLPEGEEPYYLVAIGQPAEAPGGG